MPQILHKQTILFFLLLNFSFFISNAQNLEKWHIEGNAHIGLIIQDSELAPHLSISNPRTFSVDFLKQTNGAKSWHQNYQMPLWGLHLEYTDYGNGVLGEVFGMHITGVFDLRKRPKSSLNLYLATGIGFFTNYYDRVSNHKNRMIGSTLNSSALFRLSYSKKISDKLRWQIGLGVTHYSNGATQLPNAGVNVVNLSTGLSFYNESYREEINFYEKLPRAEFSKKLRKIIYVAGAWVEQYPTEGTKYPVFHLNAVISKQISARFAWQGGVDFLYNTLYDEYRGESFPRERLSLVAGGEFNMGKITTFFQIGYYLYKPQSFEDDGVLYQRLGWRLDIHEHIFPVFSLRTQTGSVDNLEFGIGYRW